MSGLNIDPLKSNIQKLHSNIEKLKDPNKTNIFQKIFYQISVFFNISSIKKDVNKIREELQGKCNDISSQVKQMQENPENVDFNKLYHSISEVVDTKQFLYKIITDSKNQYLMGKIEEFNSAIDIILPENLLSGIKQSISSISLNSASPNESIRAAILLGKINNKNEISQLYDKFKINEEKNGGFNLENISKENIENSLNFLGEINSHLEKTDDPTVKSYLLDVKQKIEDQHSRFKIAMNGAVKDNEVHVKIVNEKKVKLKNLEKEVSLIQEDNKINVDLIGQKNIKFNTQSKELEDKRQEIQSIETKINDCENKLESNKQNISLEKFIQNVCKIDFPFNLLFMEEINELRKSVRTGEDPQPLINNLLAKVKGIQNITSLLGEKNINKSDLTNLFDKLKKQYSERPFFSLGLTSNLDNYSKNYDPEILSDLKNIQNMLLILEKAEKNNITPLDLGELFFQCETFSINIEMYNSVKSSSSESQNELLNKIDTHKKDLKSLKSDASILEKDLSNMSKEKSNQSVNEGLISGKLEEIEKAKIEIEGLKGPRAQLSKTAESAKTLLSCFP